MRAEIAIDEVPRLAARFARLVEDEFSRAVARHGSFAIAVPGGSAAETLLPALIPSSIDWGKVEVFWVDERMVPPDDAVSNYRLARSTWLDRVALPAAAIHRMLGEAPGAEEAARYARSLSERLGDPARLDLTLLGVGEDGHVASLFPGHRLLRVWDRNVAFLDDAPKPPPRRMTLTLKVLTAAHRIVVFATGAAKAGAIRGSLKDEESELPLALAMMGDAPVTMLLDPAAASGL